MFLHMAAVTEALEGEELGQRCAVQGVSDKAKGDPGSSFHNLMIQYFHLKTESQDLSIWLRVYILTETGIPTTTLSPVPHTLKSWSRSCYWRKLRHTLRCLILISLGSNLVSQKSSSCHKLVS